MQKIILLFVLIISGISVSAQSVIIEGTVRDKSDNKAVAFANVFIDTLYKSATITQTNGSYKLEALKAGIVNLYVTHIGYKKFHKQVQLHSGINHVDIELQPSFDTLAPIVITGTGTHYRIDDVPVQTEIITRKDIEEIGGRNLEDIISNISSSVDFISSSMGTNLKINGLGKDYVLILLNGKRLTGGIGGYTDLSRIDSDDIEQIEIVKGASSTLYGSDAIAGVINIITKKSQQKVAVKSNTRIGAYGGLKQFNSLTYNKGDFSGKTTYSYKQTDGWQLNNMKYNTKWESNHDLPFLVPTYDMPVNKNRGYTITQEFDYHVSRKLSLNANASWYEKTLFFPFKGRMHNYYYNNRSGAVGGKYKLNDKNFIDFSIDCGNYLYYNEFPYKYNETYITSTDVIKVTYYPGDRFKNSEQTTINTQVKGVFNINSKNTLSVGTEVMNDFLESQYRLNHPDVNANTYSIYAQDEIKLNEKLDIVAGIRSIYHDISGFTATPKISAMYKQNKFTHRFTYSNGFKSPTLKELYYYYESQRMGIYRLYLGNEDLKSQKSHYFSFSTECQLNKFRTGINVYMNRVYDMIDYRIIPTAWEHRRRGIEETKMRYNIDDARNLGFDYHFSLSLLPQLKVNGGYSYVNALNLTQNIRLNGISEHSATLKVSWSKRWKPGKLNVNLAGVYKSDRFYLEEDLKRTYAKPYQLWRITANYSFKKFKGLDITLKTGIDNIFDYVDDSPYGSHYGTLNPGRTIFGGLNIQFTNETAM